MRIQILENGPYAVDGEIPIKEVTILEDETGASLDYIEEKSLELQSNRRFLCRCGRTKAMPTCDGTHMRIGFDGTETDNRKSFDEEAIYKEGPLYNYLDNEKLCSVARFCHLGKGFWAAQMNTENESDRECIEQTGCKCTSGRLVLVDKDGTKIEPYLPQEIFLIDDKPIGHLGPLYVRGWIQVVGADGFEYELRNRVTLCRCGESKNKPFCDAAHIRCEHMKSPGL